MAGNFLKLYLSRAFRIGKVIMITRSGSWFVERMVNTEVMVYSTVGGENKLASCGKITGQTSRFFRNKIIILYSILIEVNEKITLPT